MRQLAPFERAGSHAREQPKEKVYRVQVVRVEIVRDRALTSQYALVSSPLDVFRLVQAMLAAADREHFLTLCLDTKNRVTALHTVSIGTLNSSPIHPREVFKAAVLSNAAAVILAHNHPSGDPEPSRDDIETTRRLAEAGKILGIQVLDHVVLGDGCYVSFKERGLL